MSDGVDVLTLRLDAASQARFERLRQEHFPPERNQIPAHVTLFHALPRARWVEGLIAESVERVAPFEVRVTGLQFLGKGVAYKLAAAELLAVQRELAEGFAEVLPSQDRQGFRPHVVVQNKVTPEVARGLLRRLETEFRPWVVRAEGLDQWNYLGGPWGHVGTFWFGAAGEKG